MVLHIDCNSFYASCELSLRPDLQGKPVVVANCNEAGGGIILALTKEAKALGLKRGNPVFQVKDVLNKHNVAVFAANLPKYVDISRRLMQVVKEQEIVQNFVQYSVDEFFGELPIDDPKQLREYAIKVKSHVEQCTGIPVSCGVSLTYTLAKVATWYAKHYSGYKGVCVLPADKIEKALRGLAINEVWGIGRRLAPRMEALGIHTAWDFTQKLPYEVQNRFKVTGLRTWRELHGEPCINIESPKQQKSIAHTRTFTYMTADLQQMQTYVTNFAVAAARKLRDQHSLCREVTTFIATNPHRNDLPQYSNGTSVKLKSGSADARVISKAAVDALETIFKPGFQYKRAGVILSDLDADAHVQLDLFEDTGEELMRSKKLMGVMDKINVKYGMNSLRLASQGFDTTKPNLTNFQPYKNETTDINDIIVVK